MGKPIIFNSSINENIFFEKKNMIKEKKQENIIHQNSKEW